VPPLAASSGPAASQTLLRPCTTSACLAQGRHPVMERLCGEADAFQANDTYMSDCGSLHIITGQVLRSSCTQLTILQALSKACCVACVGPPPSLSQHTSSVGLHAKWRRAA
jgi:hypothetical protein